MFGQDIGIDLGTSTVLVYVKGRGIIDREPCVVAVDSGTDRIIAVGAEAQKMLGRTPGNIIAVKPLKDGVISDYSTAERMLKHFVQKSSGHSFIGAFIKPRMG